MCELIYECDEMNNNDCYEGFKKGVADVLFGRNLRSLNSSDNPNIIRALDVIATCYNDGSPLRTVQFACFPEVAVREGNLAVDWDSWEMGIYDTVSRTIGPLERLITNLMDFEIEVAPIVLIDDKEVTGIRMMALGLKGEDFSVQMEGLKDVFRVKLYELLKRNGIACDILFTSDIWSEMSYSDEIGSINFEKKYIDREVAFLKSFYPELSKKILVEMAKIRLNQYMLQGLALRRMCEEDGNLIMLGMEYPVRQSVGQLGLLNTDFPVIFPATDSEVRNV